MADMLKKYEDGADEVTAPTTISESDRMAERKRIQKKKEKRVIKLLENLMKERKKLTKEWKKLRKKEAKIRKAEKEAAEKANKCRNNNGMNDFLSKLGDAICKAVPRILITLTTLAFGFFFNGGFFPKSPCV